MSNFTGVTFRIFPYMGGDIDTYYKHGRKHAIFCMEKSLNLFKKRYGVEWSWCIGDSFVIDVGIFYINHKKSLSTSTIRAFKQLVSTFGTMVNEIYYPCGGYNCGHLKTFNKHGYTTMCYWTDKNCEQYRKVGGTKFYWERWEDKMYMQFYCSIRYHF